MVNVPKSKAAKIPRVNGVPIRKPLPVTLLSGFLGSGKTTLLTATLKNAAGLKCAVIVNEITAENLDAQLVTAAHVVQGDDPSNYADGKVPGSEQKQRQVLEMANGCICCTLRDDLLEQLQELAAEGKYDAVLIESSGLAEPMQVAETFFFPSPAAKGRQLQDGIAPLDNCVTVCDATRLGEQLSGLEKDAIKGTCSGDADAPKDEDAPDAGPMAPLFLEQVEFANVILLNKVDLVSKERCGELCALLRKVNPTATVIPTTRCDVPIETVLATKNFTEAFASSHLGWMEDVQEGAAPHVPETIQFGISSTMFHADRPFHPERLHDWMDRYFTLVDQDFDAEAEEGEETEEEGEEECAEPDTKKRCLEEAEESSDDDEPEEVVRARREERYGNVVRGKGFVWIASPARTAIFGNWSQAGQRLNFGPGGIWREYPDPVAGVPKVVAPHQRLAFIGQHMKGDLLKADLEACLCTPEEVKVFEAHPDGSAQGPFPDPFGDWPTLDALPI